MWISVKTLDHKIFKYEMSEEDTVDTLKTRVEKDFGEENIYKLIYRGKILRDEFTLKSYNIIERFFVIVMITKPHKPEPEVKPAEVIDHEDIVIEDNTFKTENKDHETGAENKEEDDFDEDESLPDLELDDLKIVLREDTPDESEEEKEEKDEEEPATEDESAEEKLGLEWIEEQIKINGEKHFVTNKDFTIALEVVMDMEYLADIGNHMKTSQEIHSFLDTYFINKSFLDEVKNVVIQRMDDLLAVRPNYKQLEALMTDLVSIYAQERDQETAVEVRDDNNNGDDDFDEESDDEPLEVVVTAFQRNVDNIVAMGFIREEVEVALRAAFNNPDQAVDYLIGGIPPSAFAPQENPLAFLRNNPEFQHIRYLVQNNPDTLQPLLLSFGQKHPELMDTINKNKLSFVRMLHEPDGAKGFGDDSSLVVDPANSNNNVQSHSR